MIMTTRGSLYNVILFEEDPTIVSYKGWYYVFEEQVHRIWREGTGKVD
jgi:hypothetical protein